MSFADTQKPSCCHLDESQEATFIDPVCGMSLAANNELIHTHNNETYYFCSKHCFKAFKAKPEKYFGNEGAQPYTKKPAIFIGISGALSLLVIFFTIVILANGSIESALQEFLRLWYWVLILASGFGLQLGLFFHIRNNVNEKLAGGASAEVAASGTISTGSMIACCSHGLVNLLPILGVSAAAAFLAQYQLPFILFGVFSNLIGITIMVGIMQQHKIIPENSVARFLVGLNMNISRIVIVGSGLTAIGYSIINT